MPKNELSRIPIFKPKLPSHEVLSKYFSQIDENRWYSNFGPLTSELEERLSDYFAVEKDCIVALSNGTAALEAAIDMCGNQSSWSCPSWTFAATPSALLRSKRQLRFIDVDNDWRIRTNNDFDYPNILEVLPFGDRVKLSKWNEPKGTVLFDAAASFDSLFNFGKDAVNYEWGLIVSLHATKSLPAGEGGLFISNNSDWVHRVRAWSNFGFVNDRESSFVGTNAKMSEYTAAIALASLDVWEESRSKWEKQLKWMKQISELANLTIYPAAQSNYIAPYFIIETSKANIKSIEIEFSQANIETRKWWSKGCHTMNAFKHLPTSDLSKTENLSETTLALPYYVDLSADDKKRIENALMSAL